MRGVGGTAAAYVARPGLLRKEGQWLPLLAPRLPLPVPVPTRAGETSACFPQPWAVVRWVPGDPGDRTPVTRGEHAAERLAGFLRALPAEAPAEAPTTPHAPYPSPSTRTDSRGVSVTRRTLTDADATDARAVWEEAVAAPGRQGPRTWLHGDLHPAHVLVADGTFTGVIDFGDLCAGDPAIDLAAGWVLLPEGARPRFFRAYARIDAATIRRARGWAVRQSLVLMRIGRAGERGLPGGKPTWGPAGRAALGRAPADWRAAG
ncbi:phosphotransferase [Streptomyces sp. NPDC007905]|uniref:phosphotransferase n=1 Tax=Streptomyces sp. NPDC007905 TaxID=3364788 RepID=UPI0036EFFD19